MPSSRSSKPIPPDPEQPQETMTTFSNKVLESVKSAYPNRDSKRYKEVNVVFLYWDGLDPAMSDLRTTLRDIYGYKIHAYKFSNAAPAARVVMHATSTLVPLVLDKLDQPNSLIIAVYNGHGRMGDNGLLISRTRDSEIELNWRAAAGAFYETQHADVLMVMDCF